MLHMGVLEALRLPADPEISSIPVIQGVYGRQSHEPLAPSSLRQGENIYGWGEVPWALVLCGSSHYTP